MRKAMWVLSPVVGEWLYSLNGSSSSYVSDIKNSKDKKSYLK